MVTLGLIYLGSYHKSIILIRWEEPALWRRQICLKCFERSGIRLSGISAVEGSHDLAAICLLVGLKVGNDTPNSCGKHFRRSGFSSAEHSDVHQYWSRKASVPASPLPISVSMDKTMDSGIDMKSFSQKNFMVCSFQIFCLLFYLVVRDKLPALTEAFASNCSFSPTSSLNYCFPTLLF